MSFFTNKSDRCPGPITGNPTNGICERVCIQTKKVFDSCMKQMQEKDLSIKLIDKDPAVDPLTFISATSDIYHPAKITNLIIERFEERPNFARVRCTVTIPLIVNYTDANGVPGSAKSEATFEEDVVLYIPQPSIVPFQIEAFGSIATPDGKYIGDDTFNIDACVTIILKVTVEAELLVPSYGYCMIPPCQEYTEEACAGNFNLPLYPVPNK